MPRNSAGTYSLPAGNPVVSGTVISSVWGNSTLSDIGTALTGSLARNGDGGMTGQFKADAGLIGAPGVSWSAETTSGFYRAAAGDFRFAIGGADVFLLSASGVTFPGDFTISSIEPDLRWNETDQAVDEKVYLARVTGKNWILATQNDALSSSRNIINVTRGVGIAYTNIAFGNTTDNNSFQFLGTGSIAFGGQGSFTGAGSTGSIRMSSASPGIVWTETDAAADSQSWRMRVNTSGFTFSITNDPFSVEQAILTATRVVGTLSAVTFGNATGNPTYGFLGTGIITSGGVHQGPDGAIGTPAYSFSGDPNTGMFRTGADEIRFATGGVLAALFNSATRNYLGGAPYTTFADGSASFPAIGFESDQDTGFWRSAADVISVSTGGFALAGFGLTFGSGAGSIAAKAASTSSYAANFQGAGTATTIGTNTSLRLVSSAAARATGGIVFTDGVTWNSFIDAESTGALAFSVSGTGALAVRLRIETGGQLGISDGVVGTPGLGFISDPDTGIYRSGANALMIVAGGAQGLQISYGGVVTQCSFGNGNVSNPGITFLADNNKGFYHVGANIIGVTIAGSQVAQFLPAANGSLIIKDLAGTDVLAGYRTIPRSTTATTLAANDVGKCVAITAAINIPASVFSAGDCISIYNDSAGALNITISAGTLRLGGTATTGTRSLAARGIATLWFNVGGATPEVIATGSVT